MGKTRFGGIHQGWCAVLCQLVSWLLFGGLIKGLGVMLPTLKEQFKAQTWLIGWTVAIISGVSDFVSPVAGPLEAMFGTRTVVVVSGFMIGASMIVASLSTSIVQFTATLALAGPGLSFTSILTRATVGRCFTTNYATAIGIGSSGFALAMIIVAPLTQLLLDTYGWRGAMLLLGGLSLNIVACGCLLRPRSTVAETKDSYQPLSSSDEELRNGANKKSRIRAFKDALMAQKEHFGFSVCLRASFWILALIMICDRFPSTLWLIYFVPYAEAKGLSAYDAVACVTAGGIGSLVFKIGLGLVVDRGFLKVRAAQLLLILICSSALLVLPWINSYWLMMANAFVFCGASGAIDSLIDSFTRELLGVDLLVCAFSWMELLGAILCFSLGFFPGWIYDQSGSYDLAFVIMGCIHALSLVALFVEWVMSRWNVSASG